MEHVAAYVKSVDDVETKDTKDGGTKQEKIRNIREAFEINRLECAIDKVITNRSKQHYRENKMPEGYFGTIRSRIRKSGLHRCHA